MKGSLALIQLEPPLPAPTLATDAPWYILRSEVQAERKAFRWLSYQFFHTYLPVERAVVRFGRFQKRPIWKPLMPGYLFVQLPPDFGDWDTVRRMPGVDDFLVVSGHKATLSTAGIEVIRQIEADLDKSPKKDAHGLKINDRVKLDEDDPHAYWAGKEGLIQRLDKNDEVLLDLILPARVLRVRVSASRLTLVGG